MAEPLEARALRSVLVSAPVCSSVGQQMILGLRLEVVVLVFPLLESLWVRRWERALGLEFRWVSALMSLYWLARAWVWAWRLVAGSPLGRAC